MTSKVVYQGHLRTAAEHLQSQTLIETDAPVDNNGKGERFSPTDLVATALASCMMTIMGIMAQNRNWHLEGTQCEVEKIMGTEPRRIVEIKIKMTMNADAPADEKDRLMLERAAMTCPVLESLHPDLKKTVTFIWS
jgi:putative redox protein